MLSQNSYQRNQSSGPWNSNGGDQGSGDRYGIEAPQYREGPHQYPAYIRPTFQDKLATDDQTESDGDEAKIQQGNQSPHMGTENGLSKLDIPPSLLEDSTLTVFIRNKSDPQKARAYRIEQDGVFEAPELVKIGGSARQPSPPPSFKRRQSQHGTISAAPLPQPPSAPHPPRAASKKRSTDVFEELGATKAVAVKMENFGKKDRKGKGIDLGRPDAESISGTKPNEADPSGLSVDSTIRSNHAYVETEGESEQGLKKNTAVSTDTKLDEDGTVVEEVD